MCLFPSPELSFYSSLSATCYHADFSILSLPELSPLSLTCCCVETAFRQLSEGNHRIYLISIPVLPITQYLKIIILYILFDFLVVSHCLFLIMNIHSQSVVISQVLKAFIFVTLILYVRILPTIIFKGKNILFTSVRCAQGREFLTVLFVGSLNVCFKK